jgi:MGT family glycosyltransferase
MELFSTYPNALIRDSDPSRLVHLEYADVNLEYIDRYNLSAYTVDCPAMKPIPRATGLHDLQLLDATLKSQPGCPSWITAAKVIEEPAPMNLAFVPEEFMNGPPEKAARYHFLPSLYRLWPAKSKGVEKLIYASFGTRSHIIERLIMAWLQRSVDGGLKLLVSAGRQAERLQHYADANLSIESFVDQHAVLARASVFITHGGMNGVMEAILTETPMLIVPLSFEQELTARNVHKFQLGIHCPLERLETVDLQRLIMRLMDDATIRKNLQIWRAKILAAGGAHRAVDLIDQHIKGEH